jgi:CHAD domain-containing protein
VTSAPTSVAVERLRAALAAQVAELRRHEPGVRTGADVESVHDMRVAARRLRSILRAAAPMLDERWVDGLRGELAWLGDGLGAVRDLDVLLEKLHADAAALDGGDAILAATLLRPLEADGREARQKLVAYLDDVRYERLLAALDDAASTPRVERDDLSLDDLAAREFRRLRKRGIPGPELGNAALHKRRIRVKRARYAAELADPSERRRTRRFLKAAKELQDVLGAHQDAVVARRRLRTLARGAGRVDLAVAAGRLIERQEQTKRDARASVQRAWKRLRRRGDKAWPQVAKKAKKTS